MGLGTRDCVAGCGWGVSSDEEVVVVLTLQDREVREKALEIECAAVLKRWVGYGRELRDKAEVQAQEASGMDEGY